jgi:hypothetical protein
MAEKPTLKELWWNQHSGFQEMWTTSKLPHEILILIWHGGLVSQAVAAI